MNHQELRDGECICRAPWDKEYGVCRSQVEAEKARLAAEEAVKHPSHYGGGGDPFEVIKVIDAWGLGFKLGNAVKYIRRAGKKNPDTEIQDLEKAVFYINHRIEKLKSQQGTT